MDNVNVKSEYDYMSSSLRTLELRRKLVIVMYLSYLIVTVGLWLMGTVAGIHSQDPGNWIYLLIIFAVIALVSLGCSSWLYASIRNVAKAQDKELDERQRIVRNHAYRYAYRIVMVVVVLFVLFVLLRMMLTREETITANAAQAVAVFWGIFQLFTTLPTAIIAWTEREV